MNISDNALLGRFFEPGVAGDGAIRRAFEEGICKDVFEKLWAVYPGYDWKVKANASPTHGMVSISLPPLMHQAVGYHIPIDKLAGDPGLRLVKMGGGELLERYDNLRRGRANATVYREKKVAKRVHSYKDAIPA